MNDKSNSLWEDELGIENSESNPQELVEDLKNSLTKTIKDTSDVLDSIITTIDQSIMNERIKLESKNIVQELRKEFSKTLNITFNNISSSVANGKNKDHIIRNSEEE